MHFHFKFGNFGLLGLQQQILTRIRVYKIKTRFLLTRTSICIVIVLEEFHWIVFQNEADVF